MHLRVIMMSHAPTAALRKGYFPADDGLDGHGRQAILTRQEHLHLPPDATAFSSPAACARETAQALGLIAGIAPPLAELDYGRWRGQSIKDVAAQEPEALNTWLQDPNANVHGGESVQQVILRVGAWLDSLPLQGEVLALTHAPVIRAAIMHVLQLAPATYARMEVKPLAAIELQRSARGWTWWPAFS